MHIKIATRKSALALWQARDVAQRLQQEHPGLSIALIKMTTTGDRLLQESLSAQGGKGLFVKELEHGLLSMQADIAVHSMKDVPVELPSTLHVPVMLKRENPCDAFVSNHYDAPGALPARGVIGTASSRRACQIKAAFPHLQIKLLRGNVTTRLAKLDAGHYDAIILAAAGLRRLGLTERIRTCLSPEESLPAIGQGVIGIECRRGDAVIECLLEPLHDRPTHLCVRAERAVSQNLQGGCQLPIAGYAQLDHDRITLRALVGYVDGSKICRSEKYGAAENPEELGLQVAQDLRAQGADKILATVL